MTAGMVEAIVPVVALIATFGFPVAMVFVWKWFKFKDKELQADLEIRRTAGIALESRVQRLESIILALDANFKAAGSDQLEQRVPERPRIVGP